MNSGKEKTPVLMTQEFWMNSQFSVARLTGQVRIYGVEFVVVNKEGKDIFQCAAEAHRAGRVKAIEPGEPADLIDNRYLPVYRKIGRDTFIEWLKEGMELKQMQERVKALNVEDRVNRNAEKAKMNKKQTTMTFEP